MNKAYFEKLKTLLSQHANENRSQRSLKALADDVAAYRGTVLVPIEDARRTNRIRADSRKDKEGFETLLPALDEFPEASIQIHAIQTEGESLIIFTDPDVTKIVGILIIKRRNKQ
jgi:hypothetical protein